MSDKDSQDIQALDFETAFNALQESVALLENEDLPLEKALAVFERGQLLAKRCAALLEAAELKVRTLTTDAANTTDSEG
jgi:exodeoxyribonuclease VII small subunit